MSGRGLPGPFTARGALALVVVGSLALLALLYAIGAGGALRSANDGGAHGGGKGLTGYRALALLLEAQGREVTLGRTPDALAGPGVLILTPPHEADLDELAEIVAERRFVGPTILVLPKWTSGALPARDVRSMVRRGWVEVTGAYPPSYAGIEQGPLAGLKPVFVGQPGAVPAMPLPAAASAPVMAPPAEKGPTLFRPSQGLPTDRFLAVARTPLGLVGAGVPRAGPLSPELAAALGRAPPPAGAEGQPLLVVAEPDLLNNWGLADEARARAAVRLVALLAPRSDTPVVFDVTLNGLGASANLLSLAIRPPFLAATLCLLAAALLAGWMAFRRFGPPLQPERAIAYGKAALVANSAAFYRRMLRDRALAARYAAILRSQALRAHGIPRADDAAAELAALDAVAERRGQPPFSALEQELVAARGEAGLARAARALHGAAGGGGMRGTGR